MPPKRHWKPKLRTTDDAALTADFDDITSGQAINAIQAGSSVLTFDSVSQDQRRLHRESVPLPATFAFNGTRLHVGTVRRGSHSPAPRCIRLSCLAAVSTKYRRNIPAAPSRPYTPAHALVHLALDTDACGDTKHVDAVCVHGERASGLRTSTRI